MSQTQRFKDRVSQNPNRRILNIVSQTQQTIVADISRGDSPTEAGTPLNAAVLNDWDAKVDAAVDTSNAALQKVNDLTSSVDCSKANKVGIPTVKIIQQDGVSKFSFENLKGETGGTQFYFDGEQKNYVYFSVQNGELSIITG